MATMLARAGACVRPRRRTWLGPSPVEGCNTRRASAMRDDVQSGPAARSPPTGAVTGLQPGASDKTLATSTPVGKMGHLD